MKKLTLVFAVFSLLVCVDSVSAQKRRRVSPVQEEFGDLIVRDELTRKLEAADKKSKRQRSKDAQGSVNSGQTVLNDLNNNLDQITDAPIVQDFKLPQVDLSRLLSGPPKREKPKSQPAPRRKVSDPVMQEFGPAIHAEARRAERRAKTTRPSSAAPRVPSDLTPAAVARTSKAFDPYPFVSRKLPDAFKEKKTDRYRATNPRKVSERGKKPLRVNESRFPIKPRAVVYDAFGKQLGRLSPTVRLEVNKVKQKVPQQIKINKNESRRLKLPSGKKIMVETAVGVQLMNGMHVSGLVKRTDIPRSDRPKQARPKRLPAPGRETIQFEITGGDARLPPPKLYGIDSKGKRVPLKFQDPKKNTPRGFKGPHQEANDYLLRPINKGATNNFYVNLLRTLPGRGGIARSVVKINRGEKSPPIFEVFTSGSARSRNVYLPGQRDPKTSLFFLKGRLQGAKQNLGPVFIATPNLSPFPAPSRRH